MEYTLMLSQQDMEDFMEIEATLVERDEDAAKLGKPSGAVQGGINAGDEVRNVPDPRSLHRDYLQEGMRSLLSASDQVSELLAQVIKRS
jgi:hypothetical protein